MSKALSSVCLAFLICFGGSAWADKPKLAILGLEVTPGASGVVDPAATQAAKDITKELRSRAQSGASPYVMAPNSSKELTDEKLLMSCDNEAKDCMAVIGAGLAADMLLYGRVEKKGEVYKVSLKLLDVKAKTLDVGADEMPVGASATGVSRRLYTKLIGDSPNAGGTLVVIARSKGGDPIDGGKVMVDDERKGVLSSGKLTINAVPEGRHVVAIETDGFRRYEETVTVRAEQQTKISAALVEREPSSSSGPSTSSSSNTQVWKVALGAGLAVGVIGGGLAGFSYWKTVHDPGQSNTAIDPNTNAAYTTGIKGLDQSDCDKSDVDTGRDKHSVAGPGFRDACSWHTRIYVGYGIAAVGTVGAAVAVIMLVRDHGEEKPPTSAGSKKSDVAIAPIITPDLTGASLSLTW